MGQLEEEVKELGLATELSAPVTFVVKMGGLAAPVVTPLSVATKSGQLGARP